MFKETAQEIKNLSAADLKPLYAQLIASMEEKELVDALENYDIVESKDLKTGFSYDSILLSGFLLTQDDTEKIEITNKILSDMKEVIGAFLSVNDVAQAFYFAADFNQLITLTSQSISKDYPRYALYELSALGFKALQQLIAESDSPTRRSFYRILFESMDHFGTLEALACSEHVLRLFSSSLREEFLEEMKSVHQELENSGSKHWKYTHRNFLLTEALYMERSSDYSEEETKQFKKKYLL